MADVKQKQADSTLGMQLLAKDEILRRVYTERSECAQNDKRRRFLVNFLCKIFTFPLSPPCEGGD